MAVDVNGAIRSWRVIDVLSKLIGIHGAPCYLRSDNGPEFVSKALLEWAAKQSLQLVLIEPGKPWQNGDLPSPIQIQHPSVFAGCEFFKGDQGFCFFTTAKGDKFCNGNLERGEQYG